MHVIMPAQPIEHELAELMRKNAEPFNVVVMPDLFIDRIVSLDCTLEEFYAAAAAIAQRKGGSTDGIAQADLTGGNAVNTAAALAALGVHVTPIVCTDTGGLQRLKTRLRQGHVDFRHVKLTGSASRTTALEFRTVDGKANIMLRDLAALESFGPENLSNADYEAIADADYVCVFNWAGTRMKGTALAETVFRHAKTHGTGKTFLDTADPTPNKPKVPSLIEKVFTSGIVDVVSLNENEAVCYAEYFSQDLSARKSRANIGELALESARILAKHLPARVDLHTTNFSASVTAEHETVIPAYAVQPLRATGAGDAWNAGNIIADAYRLPQACRLTLANAVAAMYLTDHDGNPPTRKQLIQFLQKPPPKKTLD